MKPVTSLLSFLLCALAVSPVQASIVMNALPLQVAADSSVNSGLTNGQELPLNSAVLPPSLVEETMATLKSASTMQTADNSVLLSDTGDAPTDAIPISLNEIAATFGSGDGFFFESPDAPGSGLGLATVSSSAPAIRMMSSETPNAVPLPPALLLFGTGLVGCLAARTRQQFRERRISPLSVAEL